MHDIMVKPLPPGCRLTAIFDCCHSGSALDLPHEYSVDGKPKEQNLIREAAKGLLNAGASYYRDDVGGLVANTKQLFTRLTHGKKAREISLRTKSSPADVIQFSGCKDYEKSADTVDSV
jgi:metacaspase-1